MSIEVTMPRLSDTMENGTVVSWNVKEGDSVSAGDVLADIETDKATMELQAFDDGTVATILIQEGQSVEVGKPILLLAEEGEDPQEVKSQTGGAEAKAGSGKQEKQAKEKEREKSESKPEREEAEQKSGGRPRERQKTTAARESETTSRESAAGVAERPDGAPNGEAREGRIFASPLARKLASEMGVDLHSIEGTGPSDRITAKDVEAAASGAARPAARRGAPSQGEGDETASPERGRPTPAPEASARGLEHEVVALSNMRRTIARRLVESKSTIPHYQVTVVVDMDPLAQLRAQLNEQLASQNVKLSVNDFIVRACALAMHEHPFVNSRWTDEGEGGSIEIMPEVNVGVAVALTEQRGGGLVVATLRNADRMGLRQISRQTRELADKAREKGLTIEEMSDSTFTISNLGMFGVHDFTAIINPPNAAILAVGAAMDKPVVREGRIVVGSEMRMTMSSDHRIVDGAMAARYLQTVKEMLEHPATLLV